MLQLIKEYKQLLRSIPSLVVALFVVSVVCMNLLANKTIVSLPWLALDGGIIISWLSFLTMDIVTKRFGPKSATRLSVIATLINLLTCLVFFIVSRIPSNADDYAKFNEIFGGTWFILLSSTVAFLVSAGANNFFNYLMGKLFNKNNFGCFALRTYISTFIGQFLDNLIFALLAFMVFSPTFWNGFSWTFIQCLTCALTGAIVELVFEIIFSPLGYKIVKGWEKEGVGNEYISDRVR